MFILEFQYNKLSLSLYLSLYYKLGYLLWNFKIFKTRKCGLFPRRMCIFQTFVLLSLGRKAIVESHFLCLVMCLTAGCRWWPYRSTDFMPVYGTSIFWGSYWAREFFPFIRTVIDLILADFLSTCRGVHPIASFSNI